jgi:hypothetical protein
MITSRPLRERKEEGKKQKEKGKGKTKKRIAKRSNESLNDP